MNGLIYSKEGRRTRLAYIFESSLDNCVAAVVSGAFLTMLLKRLGISDSLTGIIANLATLACTTQMFAFALAQKRRSVKRFIVTIYVVYHCLFLSLYLLPFLHLDRLTQIVLFAVFYLGGCVLNNVIYPNKFNWLMSYVPDNQQGGFTANREIVVLISGMIFNYALSAWVDRLNAAQQGNTSLILCAVTITVFSALHIFSLSQASDAPETTASEEQKKIPFRQLFCLVFADSKFKRLLPVAIVYTAATCFCTAFYSVYQLQELHFSLTFIATLTILSASFRALISRPFGRFADAHGWAKALRFAFVLYTIAYAVNCFTVPANGKVLYTVYLLLANCGAVITTTGIHTIVFAYVPEKTRTAALGIYGGLGGIAGFVAGILGGLVVNAVQKNGNMVFGHYLYAQQVVTAGTVLMMLGLVLYMIFVVEKMKTLKEEVAAAVSA